MKVQFVINIYDGDTLVIENMMTPPLIFWSPQEIFQVQQDPPSLARYMTLPALPEGYSSETYIVFMGTFISSNEMVTAGPPTKRVRVLGQS